MFNAVFLYTLAKKHKKRHITEVMCLLCWHLLIFPGSLPPSIFSASELNFCVRYGNRWTLAAINTNCVSPSGDFAIIPHQNQFVQHFFKNFFIFIFSVFFRVQNNRNKTLFILLIHYVLIGIS